MAETTEEKKTEEKKAEWVDDVDTNVQTYLSVTDDAERLKLVKKLSKDNVMALLEGLRVKSSGDVRDIDRLRQENHDQHTNLVQAQNDFKQIKTELDQEKGDHLQTKNAKDQLDKLLDTERNKKKTALSELSETKDKLTKKEELAKNLMAKFDKITNDEPSSSDAGKILIQLDPKMLDLIDELAKSDTLEWDKMIVKHGISGLEKMLSEEESRKKIYQYPEVILVLGATELLNGGDGFKIGNNLKTVCSKLKELEVEIVICGFPPAPKEKELEIDCFNMKVQSFASDKISIIDSEEVFDKVDSSEMYKDNKLTNLVFSKLSKSILEIKAPEKKSKKPYKSCVKAKPAKASSSESDSDSDDDFPIGEDMVIDPAYSGLIIGSKGKNIRQLEDETSTKLKLNEDDESGLKTLRIKAKNNHDLQQVKKKIYKQITNAGKSNNKRSNDDKKASSKKRKH